ncbi:MAG: hypothetical protein EP343_00295 [Deltaproteobacteria bacterium]|nr:MAG: hypothetical protein EP343_00295 [Deltaproteobacteria bacterium]
MFVHGSTWTVVLFSLFAVAMFALMVAALRKTRGFALWLSILLVFTAVGSLQAWMGWGLRYTIPVIPLFFGTLLLSGVVFSFSHSGKDMSLKLSLPLLLGFQSFRLPLELLLHEWAKQGTIPETMTWTGSNWDIAAGILCLLGIGIVGKSRHAAWAVNTLSFLLLLNVIRVVILSSPFPFSWKLKTPLMLAAYFPYVLIGPLFVLPALVGHLVTFRKLWDSRSNKE